MVEVQVGPKAVWKDPAHPFRVDGRLKLSGIPTLFKYEGGSFGARLGTELELAASEEEVHQHLASFCR